ncbi:MAG TPA: bifunctional riboflavin kinase/FAD synthetase [Candidatus Sulfomarinibacteraceae bacterium]|nr:bifunctional riboflavin kinase/FAD synthetase [Candidatus Sulfomarinibacteraceae bacterium]
MSPTFERVDDLANVADRRPTYLAIGVFDGVHRGHQHLLQTMVAEARRAGARPAVLTFFPHPRAVIQGLTGRLYLTTVDRRVALLAQQGLELAIVQSFNEELRTTRAADFVEQLCRALDLRQLWGGSFSLGYKREGDADFLGRLGRKKGFTVCLMDDLVTWQGERVSSSRIRRALSQGNIEEVNGCLGRPFCVSGQVYRGDRRGKQIGFPTANLTVWEQQLLPANGVYATYAKLGEKRFAAATNVGVRPTVDGAALSVEAHLLDFDREIYGQVLDLEFVARVRDERKFSGLEALKAQIAADIAEIKGLLVPDR